MTRAKQAVPFVTSAHIRNFKSMAAVEVRFSPLTVLVGLNASGKSNFLDALRFVTHALTSGLSQAVAERGGVRSVWHQPPGGSPPGELTVDLELQIGTGSAARRAHYGFTLRAERNDHDAWTPVVAWEWCHIGAEGEFFQVEYGQVIAGPEHLQGQVADPYELLLPAAARWMGFREVYVSLRAMSFHLLSPPVMRRVETRAGLPRLGPAGERLGEVLGELSRKSPEVKSRIDDYIAAVVPGALGVDEYRLPEYSTVQLRMQDPETSGIRHIDVPECLGPDGVV